MSLYLLSVLSLAAGYLIGSVSFAVLIARSRGVDIFTVGSGNPGATNVMRAVGKKFGYACFLLDAFKGVAAVLFGTALALLWGQAPHLAGLLGLIGAIVGHSFSVFLGFRGGKGVATTVGGLFALMPWVMAIGAILWLAVFFIWRYVSLASLVMGASLPLSAYLVYRDPRSVLFCLLLTAVIFVRHRSNIQRLVAGTENRATGKKP